MTANKHGITLCNTVMIAATAIKDGKVYVWGRRHNGTAGDGTDFKQGTPSLAAGLTNIKTVLGFGCTLFALSDDHKLYSWGNNAAGGAGYGEKYDVALPQLILKNVASVAYGTGSNGALQGYAIAQDGKLWGWGNGSSNALFGASVYDPIELNWLHGQIRLLATGTSGMIAVTKNNHIYSWGSNTHKTIGPFSSNSQGKSYDVIASPTRFTALEPYAKRIVQICGGFRYAVALLDDGTLMGWGVPRMFNPKYGTEYMTEEPAKVAENIAKIYAGQHYITLLTKDGAVYTLGFGGISLHSSELDGIPRVERLPAGSAIDIGGNNNSIFYQTADGKVYGVGEGESVNKEQYSKLVKWPGVEIELNSM